MTKRILDNLYLGSDSDKEYFKFSDERLVATLDLRGWNMEEDMKKNNLYRIDQTLEILHNLIELEVSTLVYCDGGIDRSPFIIACYLLKWYPWELAYDYVKKEHPQTKIHDDWMRTYLQSKVDNCQHYLPYTLPYDHTDKGGECDLKEGPPLCDLDNCPINMRSLLKHEVKP